LRELVRHATRSTPTSRRDLLDALHCLMGLKLTNQLRQRAAGEVPDNLVRPASLGTLERDALRDALAIVKRLRTLLASNSGLDAAVSRRRSVIHACATNACSRCSRSGWLLLNFPLLTLWDRGLSSSAGLPLLPLALFAGWAALIGAAAWDLRVRGRAGVTPCCRHRWSSPRRSRT
jgi:hypothetical protein